jgi:hypothetical protein
MPQPGVVAVVVEERRKERAEAVVEVEVDMAAQ